MKKNLNQKEMGQQFEKYLKKVFNGDREQAAKTLKVSQSFISQVCNGHKGPNKLMLDSMGYECVKETLYKRIK